MVERNIPQDLRKAIQRDRQTTPQTYNLKHTLHKKNAAMERTLQREADQVREENQRRLAFEERVRQIEREATRVKERDLSL